MDLYFFDFDKTLYAFDFRMRLPALSLLSGVSEYRIAKNWWEGGYETRAEAGEWPTSAEYLAEFGRVTGAQLTLENWREARALASTPIPASIAALRRASGLGTVCVLSNNPSPFAESFPFLAPDVTAIVGENRLVSCQLGVRKPAPRLFELALDRFGVRAEDTFLVDDDADNVAGARFVGIHAHHFARFGGVAQTEALDDAITRFANRNA